ncbi:hypothetical protein HPB51_026302 [Rhipicephalus microplus]|uniref:Small ribosomal subunit protein eS6 n=1 Tax=Rhipicephalus microplus TaxID=6941 RepID=A0A9J6F924_RHIMP|nr:hypothetical protein HPB51_026302 [Rhipicephalus microplus]
MQRDEAEHLYPATGCQKLIEVDDEKKVRIFYEKRMGQEVEADGLGDEWKGYVVRISGGNDKQGFPMKQGVLTAGRRAAAPVQGPLVLPAKAYRRAQAQVGAWLHCRFQPQRYQLGGQEEGRAGNTCLTDTTLPRRLGPKRASKIRKLYNLSKEDDVRQYVVASPSAPQGGKKQRSKAPKIQRLITPAHAAAQAPSRGPQEEAHTRSVRRRLPTTPASWHRGPRKPRRRGRIRSVAAAPLPTARANRPLRPSRPIKYYSRL